VAHASVTILGTPLPPATTDAGGAWRIAAVPVGEYDLLADAGNCLETQQRHLVVEGDETLDFTLASHRDSFGHVCRQSDFGFIEASHPLSLTGDDEVVAVDLPFPFTFYGTTYRGAFVATNGFLNFLDPQKPFSNDSIPDTDEPNAAVYPFWDDLFVDGPATVGTELVGTAPNRAFAIEWRDVRLVGESGRITFEAVLHENGHVEFQYGDLDTGTRGEGDSATVGIENADGTDALQYSFGEPVLRPGTSITFRRPGAAFAQGTVTDGNDGQAVAGATVRAIQEGAAVASTTTDATGFYRLQLGLGSYLIEASAPGYATATATVTLDREEELVTADFTLATGRAEVTPASLELVVPAGQQRLRQLTLRDTGAAAIDWRLEERAGGGAAEVPWLSASPASGTLAPAGAQSIGVLVDATGLAPGVYDASLVVISNSGRRPQVPVTVRLIVPAYQSAVDAGGTGSRVDTLGDTWQADQAYATGSFGYLDNGGSKVVKTSRAIDGTDDDAIYQTARQNAFEYRFDGLPAGIYEVDMRFAEPRQQSPNKRLFDVIVEGQLVLPALDVALEVGSFHADDHVAFVRVTDGQLNLRLVARKGFGQPIVNAMRVTERPDRTST
jgi:Malectin domain/Carboxypeptidase regulatory-like domain/Viral BACON domain